MCGFLGIYYKNKSRRVDRALLSSATSHMRHRGPDDEGCYIDANVGLGHRRLSIIDISHGRQPMFNEKENIVIVYNGELYNHLDIREDLIRKGHIFKTNCDTEVVVHAYEEWGRDSLEKFNGMFAFALYDKRENLLWLVRDRMGIKPLYFYEDSVAIVFGSEIKALLNTGLLKTDINENVLDSYFTLGYVPGPETMFGNIYKLDPGHSLVIKNGRIVMEKYWDFSDIPVEKIDYSTAEEKVVDLLRDSIKKRLMSDVPVGVFLSGGIDSASVVALMSELSGKRIKTFTVGYNKKYGGGETEYARKVAEKFNTEHYEFTLEPEDFLESVDTLTGFSEEPIVETAAIALFHISKLAREKAIVLLSGEGSDEIFAGYPLYRYMLYLDMLHKAVPVCLRGRIGSLARFAKSMKQKKYFDWLSVALENRYMGTSNYLTGSIKSDIYSEDFLDSRGEYLEKTFSKYFDNIAHKRDALGKMLYVDSKTWLVDDLLVKADKMTMAASIELRVPFLDHRLVEMAASLPSNYKLKGKIGKRILKDIMRDKLPREIIDRKKMGFFVPTREWFSRDIFNKIEERIMDQVDHIPWFRKDSIGSMLKQHHSETADHSKFIMTLLVFLSWRKRYIQ